MLRNVSQRAQSVFRLLEPKDAVYDTSVVLPTSVLIEDGRGLMHYNRQLPEFPKMRIDVDASIGKWFVIGDMTVQFLATYHHGLVNLTSRNSLRSNALAGTFGLIYKL